MSPATPRRTFDVAAADGAFNASAISSPHAADDAATAVPASRLDHGWWASNGPTAGYLLRLALDEIEGDDGAAPRKIRRIELHIVAPARASEYTTATSTGPSSPGPAVSTVTFFHTGAFATASITQTADRGASGEGDMGPARRPALRGLPADDHTVANVAAGHRKVRVPAGEPRRPRDHAARLGRGVGLAERRGAHWTPLRRVRRRLLVSTAFHALHPSTSRDVRTPRTARPDNPPRRVGVIHRARCRVP
ncbi:MAG: hypothetical protein QOI08_1598 [Actinomycetota bacterium]|nr:hypothetical protein [Actinomycetota bacterium]